MRDAPTSIPDDITFLFQLILLLLLWLQLFKKNPLTRQGSDNASGANEVVQGEPNTALLSTILVIGTFFLAYYMHKFRTSHFFGKRVSTKTVFFLSLYGTVFV